MQAGMFWGYVGLVDELARRCKSELKEMEPTKEVVCIATGGLAHLIGEACKEIQSIERDLTLQGLWDLYHLNQK
jgi:type III pantothenate kinase